MIRITRPRDGQRNKKAQSIAFGPNGYPELTGGIGGWESIARPRSTAAAAWVGLPERKIVLPLVLDGIDKLGPGRDQRIGADLALLESWAKPDPKLHEPPRLTIAGVQRVTGSQEWVIQNITWGPYICDNQDRIVQQELVLELLQYREPEIAKGPAKKARRRKGKGDK